MTVRGVEVRFQQRLHTPRWRGVVTPVIAVVVALVICGLLLLITGLNPVSTYQSMVRAAFTSNGAFNQTLALGTPLLFTGLAASVAFRMKIWNIGGEGQLYIGAVCAAATGIALGSDGQAIAVPAMLAAGILGGALWAAIPGLLRAYMNTSEVLTSLMLNYIAGLLMTYLIFDSNSYWRDVSSAAAKAFPQGRTIAPASFWPGFTTGSLVVPLGLVIGLTLAVLLTIVLRSSRFGFQMRVISDSPGAGRYAGMNTRHMILGVMLLSGGLAGLGGASQVGDFSHLLDPTGLQGASFGYAGIVVAAVARYNPWAVIVGSFLLGAITNAGASLQGASFPLGLVGTMEGIILLCVLGAEVFTRYRLSIGRAGSPTADDVPAPQDALPRVSPVAVGVSCATRQPGDETT